MTTPQPNPHNEDAAVREAFDRGASDYDQTRQKYVPCFEDFYSAALGLTPKDTAAPLRILDLGSGTGLLAMMLARRFPNATLTLVDISDQMLTQARNRFADEATRVDFIASDLSHFIPPGSYDLTVSALAIHHLHDGEKAALFQRIYKALNPGGIFINADQVSDANPETTRQNFEDWKNEARARGATEPELEIAIERMKQDKLATLEDQLTWLSEAGFPNPQSHFRHGWFVVYSGRKL